MTHTPYQRGRRAAERGCPREVPRDCYDGQRVYYDTSPGRFLNSPEAWLEGYDSVPVVPIDTTKGHAPEVTDPAQSTTPDLVNSPPHYTSHPSGIECIQITEHMDFLTGSAMKYIWRAGLKTDEVEDLRKAVWYLNRAIEKRTKGVDGSV